MQIHTLFWMGIYQLTFRKLLSPRTTCPWVSCRILGAVMESGRLECQFSSTFRVSSVCSGAFWPLRNRLSLCILSPSHTVCSKAWGRDVKHISHAGSKLPIKLIWLSLLLFSTLCLIFCFTQNIILGSDSHNTHRLNDKCFSFH